MAGLKELRNFIGLTQKELAEKAGVNIRQIQKYESGEYSIENMTAKTAQGVSNALGCAIDEMLNIDLDIFSTEAKKSVQDGNLTLSDLIAMDKYQKVKCLSKIGNMQDTFSASYNRIPEGLQSKLSAAELAELVDAFYQCYSDGKNTKKIPFSS
jgi:transcriptional regulator with XRE-family HTH domain